jgi:DNA-binding response OmpR family regulator
MSETQACVIVVEDEPQIRRFVCDALGKEGCTSLQAATARASGWTPSLPAGPTW